MFTVACSGTDSPLAVSPSLLRWQLSGMVRCNGGDPIAGATLEVTDGPDSGQRTTSDVNGRFVFSALKQAVVSVRASAADHQSVTRSVTLTSKAVLDFNLPESQLVVGGNDVEGGSDPRPDRK
jgi:hypothetical protein